MLIIFVDAAILFVYCNSFKMPYPSETVLTRILLNLVSVWSFPAAQCAEYNATKKAQELRASWRLRVLRLAKAGSAAEVLLPASKRRGQRCAETHTPLLDKQNHTPQALQRRWGTLS